MGVIAGVHHTASDLWTTAEPTTTSGLAEAGVADFRVAHFAEGGVALAADKAHLSGGQLQSDIVAFLGHHLGAGTGGPHHLSTTTGIELNAVNAGAEGDGGEGQGVAVLDR